MPAFGVGHYQSSEDCHVLKAHESEDESLTALERVLHPQLLPPLIGGLMSRLGRATRWWPGRIFMTLWITTIVMR
jgi:hypothetical protein